MTDRDLALKVLAEGRDRHTTRVDEVMSLNPILAGKTRTLIARCKSWRITKCAVFRLSMRTIG